MIVYQKVTSWRYYFFFVSCQEDNSIDEVPSMDHGTTVFTIDEGDYIGLWNSRTTSVTFTDLPISARVSYVSGNNYTGELFITDHFESCCNSVDSDGIMSFNISKNSIEAFSWVDVIPNCEGIFTGTGVLLSYSNLKIDIIGNDCDGDHVGTIELRKVLE